ncbi:MAG: preprotein translocase subunit SecE [Parachlamydiaceae bacterium]|nr:preprotein translocase subunit SecE [Parachlamydiaceae bacterium]
MSVEARFMEAKKTVPLESTVKKWSLFDFVGNVKEEFRTITWTNPEELQLYTKLVVGATFAFGLGIYFIDLAIQGSLHLIGILFNFIFG